MFFSCQLSFVLNLQYTQKYCCILLLFKTRDSEVYCNEVRFANRNHIFQLIEMT